MWASFCISLHILAIARRPSAGHHGISTTCHRRSKRLVQAPDRYQWLIPFFLRETAVLVQYSFRGRGGFFFIEGIGSPHAMRLGYMPIGHMTFIEGAEFSNTAQGITAAFHLLSLMVLWLFV